MSRRSLRFCMVTTFYPPHNFGGDGIFIHRLAHELAGRGHSVEVVHCVDAYRAVHAGADPPEASSRNESGITVHSLRSRAGIFSPLITHQTGHPGLKAPRLKAILNQGNFDVIHYHNISLIGPTALSYGTGIKLYTMHEHWLVCPVHTLWKFNRAPCVRKHCIPCTVYAKRPPQLWRYSHLFKTMLKHVDAFIAVSRFSKSKHLEMGLDVEAPIVHIPPFVPHPGPADSDGHAEPPHPRPYVLVVGRLEKLKGVQAVIQAFRSYAKCDLVIAGEGPYGPHLRHLAKDIPHIHFAGRVDGGRLRALFRHATALVFPSIGYETFGIVMLEAFAQRTPVVANNLGPSQEVIEQSGGGFTYDDQAGLLRAVDVLRSDPELRRTLGERAYNAYLELWTPEAHVRQYLDLIDRIAVNKGKAAASLPDVS